VLINETLTSLLNEGAGRKKHGISEASPDTQRSGSPVALSLVGAAAAHSGGAYADASAAEPAGEAPVGAEPT
jgi:hypothetical protein